MNQQPKTQRLNIKIQIALKALQKLWFWTDISQGEFSALGEVEEVLDGKTGRIKALCLTDLHLVRQSCNDVETEMDLASVAELMQTVDPNRLRCWVHSHATMDVFWSNTDEKCIAGLCNGDWMLSLVVNKKHHTLLRLDQFHPAHLAVNDLEWEICFPLDETLETRLREEFQQKVGEHPLREARKSKLDLTSLFTSYGVENPEEIPNEQEWLMSEMEEEILEQ